MLATLKGERVKITDHLVCTSENSTYCITCIHRREIYISETGRLLGDLTEKTSACNTERNENDASKPVAGHFTLLYH